MGLCATMIALTAFAESFKESLYDEFFATLENRHNLENFLEIKFRPKPASDYYKNRTEIRHCKWAELANERTRTEKEHKNHIDILCKCLYKQHLKEGEATSGEIPNVEGTCALLNIIHSINPKLNCKVVNPWDDHVNGAYTRKVDRVAMHMFKGKNL